MSQQNQVQSTTDYDKFTKINGNRDIDWKHVAKLVESMNKNYIPVPGLVNKRGDLVDGQHRNEACRILDLPFYYTVVDGGVSDVQSLNHNVKKWSNADFLKSFCDMGIQDYIIYRDFREKYKFDHQVTVTLLLGGGRSSEHAGIFNTGAFKIKNLANAIKIADFILKVKEYYPGYNRRSFVSAMVSVINKTDFDMDVFLHKLKIQQTRMVDCAKIDEYVTLIKKIYNYANKKKI